MISRLEYAKRNKIHGWTGFHDQSGCRSRLSGVDPGSQVPGCPAECCAAAEAHLDFIRQVPGADKVLLVQDHQQRPLQGLQGGLLGTLLALRGLLMSCCNKAVAVSVQMNDGCPPSTALSRSPTLTVSRGKRQLPKVSTQTNNCSTFCLHRLKIMALREITSKSLDFGRVPSGKRWSSF